MPILYAKIQRNKDFCMRLLTFLEHIIKCFAKNDAFSDILHRVCFNTHEANITKDFKVIFIDIIKSSYEP